MLFKSPVLEKIKTGKITLAFRCWQRPSVKPGGRLRTPVGELAIQSVDPINPAAITLKEATQAGFDSVPALLSDLRAPSPDTQIYRITFTLAGPDTRIALRNDADLSPSELATLKEKLARLDKAAKTGPWTAQTLRIIQKMPAQPARLLAPALQMDTAPFKLNVRKLKNLGLTESLGTGYRLSPRGIAYLHCL